MDAAKIAAIGIVAGILAITLRRTRPEIAVQVSIAAGIVIILTVLKYLVSAVDFIRDFAQSGAFEGVTVVLRIVGIAYICEFSVQILKDMGEGAVASKVELGGKLIIMVLALPMLRDFAETVLSLMDS